MKKKWILLKIGLFLMLLIFLVSFSDSKYRLREIQKVEALIDYKEGNRFITHEIVDSILSKTHPDFPKMAMQKVNQLKMESILKDDEYISDANVFLENNGILHVQIEQETPIARVKDKNSQYYITRQGKSMHLSPYFAANTMLVSGKIYPEEYQKIINLTQLINGDKLLKNHIIGIRKITTKSFILVVNDGDYFLELGELKNLDKKLENYKIFYQEFISKSGEMPYKKINLRFNNQIVAVK